MKDSILKNVTQIILIVFSVVLGLYLSERIEDRKAEKEATKLLSKIKSELKENKKLLDVWVPYHGEVIKGLDSLINDELFIADFIENKSRLFKVFTKGTIMSEMPSNDAWDIAKSHPLVVNFDYDELLILSRIYKQQKSAFVSVPKLIDVIISPDFNARNEARSNLEIFKNKFNEIYSRELQLINYYEEAEGVLGYQEE